MSEAPISTAPGDQRVDETDDRRFARQILEALEIGVAIVVLALAGRVGDPVDRRAAFAVKPLIGRLDVGRQRDPTPDLLVEGEFERADRPIVERIGHRDDEGSLALGERNHPRLLEERPPEALGGDGLGREVRGVEDRRPDQLGISGGQVAALGDEAELGGDMVEPLAAFRFEAPGAFKCRSGQEPAARQPLSRCLANQPLAAHPA